MRTAISLATIVVLSLGGCAFDKAVRDDIDADLKRLETAAAVDPKRNNILFRRHDYPWLGDRVQPYAVNEVEALPAQLSTPIEIKSTIPVTMQTIIAFAADSDLPVDLAPDLAEDKGILDQVLDYPMASTIRGYLDHATSQTHTYWSVQAGRVVISKYMTKNFPLPMIKRANELTASITNATSSGATGGGGQGQQGGQTGGGQSQSGIQTSADTAQTATATVATDPHRDLVDALNALKSDKGTVSVSASLAMISVRDTPLHVAAIERYLSDVGKTLGRQIALDITIASVQLNDANALGIDWSLVRAGVGDFWGVGMNGFGNTDPANARAGISVIDPRSPYADSTLLLDALRTQGRVSMVDHHTPVVINAQVASVQDGEERKGQRTDTVQAIQDAGIIRTTSVSRLTTGTTINVLPMIMQDQRIMLHIDAALTRKEGEEIDGTGDNAISVPIVSKTAINQIAYVESGATLVLSRLERSRSSTTDSGIGSPGFKLFGGKRNTQQGRTITLILVTPRILP